MNKNKTINDELLEELYDEQQEEQLTDTDTDSSQSKNDSMDELNKKLDESEKEKEQYKNKYLYTLAEFDNFKKRTAKEKLELKNIVISDMANKVFEIIDDFEIARENYKKTDDAESLKEGFDVLYDKFNIVLKGFGIKKFESYNKKFDTDYHEAILITETGEVEPGNVSNVLKEGYMMGDKVIRHAKVMVEK